MGVVQQTEQGIDTHITINSTIEGKKKQTGKQYYYCIV